MNEPHTYSQPPDLSAGIYAACVLVMNQDGLVLMAERKESPGVYALPGGKIEPGETPAMAGARELYEETGISVEVKDLVPIHLANSVRSGKPVILYSASSWSGSAQQKENGVNVKWGDGAELLFGPFRNFYWPVSTHLLPNALVR